MKLNATFILLDLLFNWFFVTPLVVTFWYGTYLLQEQFLFNSLDSRLLATSITLSFGILIELFVTFYQNEIFKFHSGLPSPLANLFPRYYNYLLAVANVCHYRAVQEIFDSTFGQGNYVMSMQVTMASFVLLLSLKAMRNISAVPFVLSIDPTDSRDWYNAPTLYNASHSEQKTLTYTLDVSVTVLVVWTLGPLHWITLGYFYDGLVYPDDVQTSMFASCLIGYFVVGVCSYFQFRIKDLSLSYHRDNRYAIKTILEDLFIWLATAGVIMVWKGLGMSIDTYIQNEPLLYNDYDISAWVCHLMPIVILSVLRLSSCLVGKGAEQDGSFEGGEGVEFSRLYLRHFFSDYIKEEGMEEKIN